ncbi:uncharacterized protein LOC18426987 isoform X1 [Amborella trichopoda]|uniref:uncharacterized protein LOC18426987 isoform X1 n=2 Tax=Amborella trichopoda TaxID=13333 RepID=UPI0005D302ED|nr:uncharacterized protein LOC18426987 isoform X1 [Amborella trichopoda]|eukprot:XP_011620666.1 uncharacterized protein LOC18426987 isoform X1 [Amborella trichopoda]
MGILQLPGVSLRSYFEVSACYSSLSRKHITAPLVLVPQRRDGFQMSGWYTEFTLPSQPILPAYRIPIAAHTLYPRYIRQALSGETEGAISNEDMILDEQALDRELESAIQEENYNRAAELRDKLQALQESSKAGVLNANTRFYNAFRSGDLEAMRVIWLRGENTHCVHPGAGMISGCAYIMESWELVAGADVEFPLKIDLQNVEVHVKGDVGYVTCLELVKTKGSRWGKQVATNVFERVGGEWFICIHHASHVTL